MDNSYRKIRLIFLLIIALPTIVFSIYEIGSYKENEKVIQTIYNKQLDAILFSVNQYSDAVISEWAARLDIICNLDESEKKEKFASFRNERPGIEAVYQYDINIKPLDENILDEGNPQLKEQITNLLKDSIKMISKLEKYLKEGYRKIDPFKLKSRDNQLIVFLIEANDKIIVNALVLNSVEFIEDVLDPKIQEISQDKFYIGAYLKEQSNVVYNLNKLDTLVRFEHSRPFWFFTDYYIGIELKDQTVNQVVESRSLRDIYAIAIIDLVLLFGAWLIYRNLKKQMELAQLKSDFIANISHEIRTPLALINLYIETLDMGRVKTEEKKKEYYSIIYSETQRLANLVNKILNFSHIDNNKRKFYFAKINVNELINELIDNFKFHLTDKNFELKIELEEELPQIMADKDALADAIINLIDNAIKYSGENKFIRVKTGKNKNEVFIEIKDNGIGITGSEQKKIFDKFYRVTEKDLANKVKGFGLGLSIVKQVIDTHNGRITVESKPGSGTSFKLLFPTES